MSVLFCVFVVAAVVEIKDLNIENCRKLTDVTLDHLRKFALKLQVSVMCSELVVCAQFEEFDDADGTVLLLVVSCALGAL